MHYKSCLQPLQVLLSDGLTMRSQGGPKNTIQWYVHDGEPGFMILIVAATCPEFFLSCTA